MADLPSLMYDFTSRLSKVGFARLAAAFIALSVSHLPETSHQQRSCFVLTPHLNAFSLLLPHLDS